MCVIFSNKCERPGENPFIPNTAHNELATFVPLILTTEKTNEELSLIDFDNRSVDLLKL